MYQLYLHLYFFYFLILSKNLIFKNLITKQKHYFTALKNIFMKKLFPNNEKLNELMKREQPNNIESLQKIQDQAQTISNKQKIMNLHQRIKMLDKFNSTSGQKKVHEFSQINENNLQSFQSNQENFQDNITMGGQSNFLKRSTSPNIEFQSGIKNSNFRNEAKKNVQSPSNLNHNSRSQLTYNNSQSNLSRQFPSPKHHQNYQSQNQSFSNPPALNRPNLNPLTQFYPIEAKYLSIQQRFLKNKLTEQNLMRNIESQIHQLQQSCQHLKRDSQKCCKNNQQLLDNAQKSINFQIQQLYDQLKQLKKGALQSIDTKYKAIKSQTISMINQQFQNQCKSSSQQLHTQMQGVKRIIQKQQSIRDETTQFLITSFGDQIIKLQQVINKQRQTRIQKNNQILKLINQLEDEFLDKVNKEKREMVDNIEGMENMLEEVCYKIQEKILGV